MVILTISVNARSSKRNELLSTCQMISEQTLRVKGCITCCISHDIGNENIINIKETWERRSYLDEHFRSEIFSVLLGAVKLLGESYAFRINDGSQIEGMQAVEAARLKEGDRKQ